jgi:metallo-beta-lactamase class B
MLIEQHWIFIKQQVISVTNNRIDMRHPVRAAAMLPAIFIILIAITSIAVAQRNPKWTEPFKPFRIVGNLYYVGSRDIASYLIATPQGHILINSGLEANVPMIRASVKALGLRFKDVKILLISHAHFDHCAGSAAIVKLTGARYMVMDSDVAVVQTGGEADFQYGSDSGSRYPAASVNHVLHDGDTVRLANIKLVAHRTPGHTKGCTTWTIRVGENGKSYDVVIIGSCGVNPGYKLAGNDLYPTIAWDYEHTFHLLKSLPCDYFLGAHASYFDMETKYARLKKGGSSPFIDPDGYREYVEQKEQDYREELEKQAGVDSR